MFFNLIYFFSSKIKKQRMLTIKTEEAQIKKENRRINLLERFVIIKSIKEKWRNKDYTVVNETLSHYSFNINNKDHLYGIVSIVDFLDLDISSSSELFNILSIDLKDIETMNNEGWIIKEDLFSFIFDQDIFKSEEEAWFFIYTKHKENSSLHSTLFNIIKVARIDYYENIINSKIFIDLKNKYELKNRIQEF